MFQKKTSNIPPVCRSFLIKSDPYKMENLDELKHDITGEPRYKLSAANVFVSPGGFHYIDHLDPVEDIPPEIDGSGLTQAEVDYIEKSLQSNPERLANQIAAVKRHITVTGRKALDIGCGGGLFLAALQREGAEATGIELSDTRAFYSKTRHGFEVVKRPIEDDYWKSFQGMFDIVALWDVIEHVPDPAAYIRRAAEVLKPGGILALATPDVSSLPARLTGRRWVGYKLSEEHVYYFSTATLTRMLEEAGFEVISSRHIGKYVTLRLFLDRLSMYSALIARPLAWLERIFRLSEWSLYVNPFDIVAITARRK
ncbi:class I SAM-dependent methyltransferase [Anaerolineae bacterium CFX9]|nr:class I SAM-dependent methyltransferase [Anaerolineae bacterium CFX9]